MQKCIMARRVAQVMTAVELLVAWFIVNKKIHSPWKNQGSLKNWNTLRYDLKIELLKLKKIN